MIIVATLCAHNGLLPEKASIYEKAFNNLTGQRRNQTSFGGKQVWYLNALGAKIIMNNFADLALSLEQINQDQYNAITAYMNPLTSAEEIDLDLSESNHVKPAYQFAIYQFNVKLQPINKLMTSGDFMEKPLEEQQRLQEDFFNKLIPVLNHNYEKITNALKQLKAKPKRLPRTLTLDTLKAIAKGKTDFADEY